METVENFIKFYIIHGHTVSEEAMDWIDQEIESFLDDWEYKGIKYGLAIPLILCLQRINESDNENKTLFTRYFELNHYKYCLKNFE